jgi:hypothetical protein
MHAVRCAYLAGRKRRKINEWRCGWKGWEDGGNGGTNLESLETLLSTGQLGNGAHQFGRDRVEFGAKGAACGRGELRISKRQRHDVQNKTGLRNEMEKASYKV